MPRRPSRPISLAGLRGFEASARLLSFTRAAGELNLTQSSISRQIRTLEQQVGKPLFGRRTRALELTPAGQHLYRVVGASLADIDRAVTEVRGDGRRQRLMVTTVTSFASLLLMPRLTDFSRRHPELDIRIDASDTLRDLRADGYDIAVRYCPIRRAPADGLRLIDEQLVAVLSPALANEIGPLDSPADFARTTFLVEASQPPHDDFYGNAWEYWFAQTGMTMPADVPRLTLSYTYQALQAALAGQGVMLAPLVYAREHLASGRLVKPFEASLASPFAFYLMINPDSRRQRHIEAFGRWLIGQFGEEPQRTAAP